MSDEISGTDADPTDAELSVALRQFAARNETYSPLTGAQVRGRAARRARRRVTGILVAATAAVALVAYASTLDLTDSSNPRHSTQPAAPGYENGIPAATTTAETPVPSPATPSVEPSTPVRANPVVGTLSLDKRVMFIGKRIISLSNSSTNTPKFTGPLTVYDRRPDIKLVSVANPADGSRYNAEISYAVELRDADNTPVYVGAALRYDKENVGGSGGSGGWIDLSASDAKWFYTSMKTGTSLAVTGTLS
ncbi:hypothetical protein ACIO53_36035 [Streptomyces sp. NPDC087305]|uniref:hypothetical protein n=1 Tax=Streptomyces sp. NPDC087305 TaxID=3365781 RepID=UPI00382F7A38